MLFLDMCKYCQPLFTNIQFILCHNSAGFIHYVYICCLQNQYMGNVAPQLIFIVLLLQFVRELSQLKSGILLLIFLCQIAYNYTLKKHCVILSDVSLSLFIDSLDKTRKWNGKGTPRFIFIQYISKGIRKIKNELISKFYINDIKYIQDITGNFVVPGD